MHCSMTLLIKVCGLKTREALEVALDAGADAVGFVFFPPSPRHVAFEAARDLGAQTSGRALKVALSVDAEDVLIETITTALEPDMLQLHGQESPERVAAIRRRFGLPVMKAIKIATAADLAAVSTYAAVADHLLFDAVPGRGATRPGGLGRSFDWQLLSQLDPSLSFMLSGGLRPDNVAIALAVTRAAGVDVSSGVECAPGEKDPDKIRAFIRAAREAQDRRVAMAKAMVT